MTITELKKLRAKKVMLGSVKRIPLIRGEKPLTKEQRRKLGMGANSSPEVVTE